LLKQAKVKKLKASESKKIKKKNNMKKNSSFKLKSGNKPSMARLSGVENSPMNKNGGKDLSVELGFTQPYDKHIKTVSNYFKKGTKNIPSMKDIGAALDFHKNARGGAGVHEYELGKFFNLMQQSMTEKDPTDPYYLRSSDAAQKQRRRERLRKRNQPFNEND
tara:strand:- start:192 stop:680 length:489 start_codon:yes stop_codon:yes gene_type:complete